jgi:hypothetical protein
MNDSSSDYDYLVFPLIIIIQNQRRRMTKSSSFTVQEIAVSPLLGYHFKKLLSILPFWDINNLKH